MDVLTFFSCARCTASYFPRPICCATCGGARFVTADAAAGVVEEVTCVRHAVGTGSTEPNWLATVRLAEGPRVIARLPGELPRDTAVRLLLQRDGAIVAVRAQEKTS
jgi:uncharacterized OB-fold protein